VREVTRVLAPGGSLHVVDFGGTTGHTERPLARLAHRGPHQHGDAGPDIPTLIRAAGLTDPRETGHGVNVFGRYTYHRADR
jgi:hypothetical protein